MGVFVDGVLVLLLVVVVDAASDENTDGEDDAQTDGDPAPDLLRLLVLHGHWVPLLRFTSHWFTLSDVLSVVSNVNTVHGVLHSASLASLTSCLLFSLTTLLLAHF